ncbi:MAG: aminopeptidase, partial [Firmicutes bacterium]|nr:aminopeptidase [Bacillota bacterium]
MLEIKAVVYSPQLDTDFLFFTTENDLAEIEWPNAQAEKLTKARGLEGKFGELGSFQFEQNSQIRRLLTVGLGKTEELDLEKMRRALGQALQEAEKLKVKNLTIAPLAGPAFPVFERARVLTEAAVMASYRFERYLAEKKGVSLASLQLAVAEGDLAQAEQGLELGLILGRATNLARDLVNEPANCLTPEQLAQKARQAGEGSGFEVEILDENSIVKLGMKAFLEVGKASANRPKLIIMRHLGNPEDPEDILGLVGKGITFDSGGLSIKPGASMATMKFDMGGAAAVIGAMSAIARRELPLNVVAVVAACENLISGRGYRPGDIIGTMAGKNILINSTDAEGRLTLADAVHYII